MIVNADDFGSFACVSRGIIEASRDGVVRATSVLATAPRVAELNPRLADAPELDVGVHLTLTSGVPLSREMRALCADMRSLRPSSIFAAVLLRRLRAATVRAEWRAQIDRCAALGVRPLFLNTHEHVHALAPLFDVVRDLAAEVGIRHVRTPTPATRAPVGPRALVRAAAFAALRVGRTPGEGPAVLGLHEAGRLCADDVERMFAAARPGRVYELCCHPGRRDEAEIRDRRLLRYHDWDGERTLLTGPAVRASAARHGVDFIGFRDL